MSGFFDLDGPQYGPQAGGAPRQVVVLLHGLGANGADLIGLAPEWAPLLPHAEFLAPDAPFDCDMAPVGRQWFSLADRDPTLMAGRVQAVAPVLGDFLDGVLADRRLNDGHLALVGFSQGTMMALHVAMRRPGALAGVLGYSGALVAPEALAHEITARPPVMLIHGDADPVVPFSAMAAAASALTGAGVGVETERRPGLGHGIDVPGLRSGARFLVRVFGAAATRHPIAGR